MEGLLWQSQLITICPEEWYLNIRLNTFSAGVCRQRCFAWFLGEFRVFQHHTPLPCRPYQRWQGSDTPYPSRNRNELWTNFSCSKRNICVLPQQKCSAIARLSGWVLEFFKRNPQNIFVKRKSYINRIMFEVIIILLNNRRWWQIN